MIFVGIDPGLKGGLAVIDDTNSIPPFAIPFDEEAYINTLRAISCKQCFACVERVSAMPGQGVTSMFTFGSNFGWIQGVIRALKIPYELVIPQRWKKTFGVTSDKNTSITVCKRLFPDTSLLPTERCRKDSDGLAEALIIAEWGRRHLDIKP